MRFLHIADTHIGRRMRGWSLLDDHRAVLSQIGKIAETRRPDAVLIAGDVYDKSLPSEEAVALLDSFLTSLAAAGAEVFLIAGNHDSAERLSFLRGVLGRQGVHIAGPWNGEVEKWGVKDADVYLLPYLRRLDIARFSDTKAESLDEAFGALMGGIEVDKSKLNIILSHQFVAGAEKAGSEDIIVGGENLVDWRRYDAFDYVALGHIHRAQKVGRDTVRYSGSVLKCDVGEPGPKSATWVEMEKGKAPAIEEIPLKPLHEVVRLEGTLSEILSGPGRDNDFVAVSLTGGGDTPEALPSLQRKFPLLVSLEWADARPSDLDSSALPDEDWAENPGLVFRTFFESMKGSAMSEAQEEIVDKLISEIWRADL